MLEHWQAAQMLDSSDTAIVVSLSPDCQIPASTSTHRLTMHVQIELRVSTGALICLFIASICSGRSQGDVNFGPSKHGLDRQHAVHVVQTPTTESTRRTALTAWTALRDLTKSSGRKCAPSRETPRKGQVHLTAGCVTVLASNGEPEEQ